MDPNNIKLPNNPLPVINLSNLNTTTNWFSACKQVRNALDQYGTFIAVYDDDDDDHLCLRAEIKKMMDQLFDLPMHIKVLNTSDHPFCGYTGQIPQIPLLEAMGVEDATSFNNIHHFCNLMWPPPPPPHGHGYNNNNNFFSEIIQEYTEKMVQLEQKVSKMVFQSYGIADDANDDEKQQLIINDHIASKMYMLRFNKYSAPGPNKSSALGAHVHTDKSFITILDQINQVNALQLKLKDGQWIAVHFPPSSFLVMAGEGLLAWSNGRVEPIIHRVQMSGNDNRFSTGLFSYQKGIVEIPQVFIDDRHPQCYKPFDHLRLLTFYAHQQDKIWENSESNIKDYCGV